MQEKMVRGSNSPKSYSTLMKERNIVYLIDLPLPLVGRVLPHEAVELAPIDVGIVLGKGCRMPWGLLTLIRRNVRSR